MKTKFIFFLTTTLAGLSSLFYSCTKFDKPVACIDTSSLVNLANLDTYINNNISIFLSSSCSKSGFVTEWTMPDKTKRNTASVDILPFVQNLNSSQSLIFKLKVTAKDGKQSDSVSYKLSTPISFPSMLYGHYYDYTYDNSCPLSCDVGVESTFGTGIYDFYIEKYNNSSNRLGAKITSISYIGSYPTVKFTIPSQTIGAYIQPVSGTGTIGRVLNGNSSVIRILHISLSGGPSSNCSSFDAEN